MIQYEKLMFLKELILTSQINQKDVRFVIIGILKTLVINMNNMFVMDAIIYQ